METRGTIYVVDPDVGLRKRLSAIAAATQTDLQLFDSAEDFQGSVPDARPGCLLLEMDLPGMSGLELYELIRRSANPISTIFVTASATMATAVEAMKRGSYTVLEKPCSFEVLQVSIQAALQLDRDQTTLWRRLNELRRREQTLTDREREVLEQIVLGRLNKSIAKMLTLSQRTIENERSVIMKKFQVGTAPELAAIYTEYRMLSGKRWRIDLAAKPIGPNSHSVREEIREDRSA